MKTTNRAADLAPIPYHRAVAALFADPRYVDLRDAIGTVAINAGLCPDLRPRLLALRADMAALRAGHGLPA